MKRALLMLCLLLFSAMAFSAEKVMLGNGDNSVSVLNSTPFETQLQFKINSFEKIPVSIDGAQWYHISLAKEGITQEKGMPELPVLNRSIIIDNSALVKLEVYDVEYQDIRLAVAPSKGIIKRNVNPADVPYSFDKIYMSAESYPAKMLSLSEPYILRDFRGITVQTTPFSYNPASQTLRVYTSYKVRVYNDGTDTVNTLNSTRSAISKDFSPIYENHFLNWDSYRYTPVSDSFGKLLVICHTNYLTQIAPYVNWKKQKGITTELVEWSTIGSTAAQLQTYIQNRYTADTSINYVQLVGDAAQIPTLTFSGGGSDPSFARVAGTDYYPDIFIGRFSAESTTDVITQVNKTIAYERDATTADTWLSMATGIASNEGGGSTGDNGESDQTHMTNIRTDLLAYGYTTVDQIYQATGGNAANITTALNAGRGFVNYVGHGSDTSWASVTYTNTNVNALTNGSKLPFIMDVACVNGNFVSLTCFAEAWMRKSGGGAVAIYASSINQDWNPPMLAQDECTDLILAGTKTTLGGLYYNSSCKMMDTYGSTSSSSGTEMYMTWHIFGDASLMARTKTPQAMTVTHPATMLIGATSVTVNTGVSSARVALTYNNTIYGVATANSSGVATVTLTNPPASAITYTVTATAYNRVTYVGSLQQIAGSGPYMSVESATYADSNNNVAEYNESGRFNVTFKNIGTTTASNVTATLSSSTSGISITDNSETIASLASNASTTINNAFSFTTANNMVNGTTAAFVITMVAGSETWTYEFSKTIAAPILGFGSYTINDAGGDNDGKLDPGETVTVTMPLSNTGAAASPAGTATLSSPTSGITINTGTVNFTAIAASGSTNLSFNISASSGMTIGTLGSLVFNAAAGAYTASKTESVEVGAPTEITIGAGTSSQTYPIDRYYNYSAHEAIYLASEVGAAGTIKSIAFNKASGTDVSTIEAVTIYMKNSSTATLATGTYSTTGYTQVYSGTFPNTATSGWMEVNLNTQFAFDGVSNLHILTVKGNQAYITTYPNWTYTTSSTSRARQAHSDTAAPTSLTSSTNLPNIKLKMFPAVGVLYPAQNLAATSTHGSVTLTWSAPISGTPTGYKIYRNSSLLTTVTGLTYTDTAVTTGSTYSYYVKAAYSSGDADATATVNATPTAAAPQSLAATVSNLVVNLSWSAPTSGTPASYKVYRNSSLLTTVTALSYSDTAVSNGTSYAYYVTAVYSSPTAESAASNTVNATPNATAPTNLTATPGNTLVNLSWTAATGRGEEAIDAKDTRNISGYKVYRNSVAITTVSATTYQDTGLTNGSSYSYYVTTVYSNPAGESAASNTVNATPAVVMEAIIGTGTSATGNTAASPINVYYKSLHGQSVYTAAELTAAGITGPINITQLGFNITNLPTIAMPSFVVRMKHTTATDVASWVDNTNLVTVYSNTSYLPTATGYNMYTLSTPFLWNGTDNILVDTAFSVFTPAYASTGQVQYTTVTNGYRYVRLDTADQTAVFTGGSTATTRPNVKFMFAPIATGPAISASPTSVSATVYEGESTSATVTIYNSGTAALTWNANSSLSTWGTVSPSSGTIAAGASRIVTISMNSTGLSVGAYNSTLAITSNATTNPNISIPVSFTVNTSPYPVGPRFVAEWENATGVIIAYASGFGLPYNMIADLSTRGKVYVVVTSGSQSTASSALSSNGVTMSNVYFINPTGVNTYWTRDYGPWTIMDSNGDMGIVDFTYNRVRPYDDVLNATLDNYFSYDYYELPLVATGGNVMTDGYGKMMSTRLILTENDGVQNSQVTEFSYTQTQIENLVQNYLGASEYQFYTDPLANSSIDHIDCFAKLLDVDKVIIARVPSTHTNYTALEAVVAEWQSKTSSLGTPYQIFRVDQSSNNEPYTNSFIYNKKIYVPQWNSTASSYDTAALAVYRAAMPGYTVQGYYNSSFLSDDAVHCRINTIFDPQMVHTRHVPPTSAQALGSLSISADITHSNALSAVGTYVAYKHGSTGTWQYASLSNTANDTWTASIPTPALGQTVYYYILATDTTARTYTTPLCGASDPYDVVVNIPPANQAPSIVLPDSFNFDKNSSLEQSFATFISDPDGNPLSLSVSGNTNVTALINGSIVSFSATTDWIGSETLTFTVSDGTLQANDTVVITVLPVNTPTWEPVDYPTAPAIVYAVVTIDYIPAQVNDWVAAFVGEECRGTGIITMVERNTATTSLDVNLAAPGEVVTFKIYCYEEDTVYDVPEVLPMDPGTTYGEQEPVVLNGTSNVVMSTPQLSIQNGAMGAKLVWNPVQFAGTYQIWACTEPFGQYILLGTTNTLSWDIDPNQPHMFFKIVAAQNAPARSMNASRAKRK